MGLVDGYAVSSGVAGPFGGHATLGDVLSYWKYDEASGTRYDAVTATGNDMTDNNTVGSAAGKKDDAASFVAANSEYLSRANASLVNWPQADLHIAGWVYWLSAGAETNPHFWCKRSGAGTREWRLHTTDINPRLQLEASSDGSSEDISINCGANSLPADAWQFVELKRVGTTISIAVNNAAFVSGTLTAVFNGTAPLIFGGINGGGVPGFNLGGYEDATGIWPRGLTAQESSDLWASGAGLFY